MKSVVSPQTLACSILLGSAVALTTSTTHAQTTLGNGVSITEQDESGNADPSFFTSFSSTGDKLQGATPAAGATVAASTGNFANSGAGGVGLLTDASVPAISTDHSTQAAVGYQDTNPASGNNGGTEVNYAFPVAVKISSIALYGGWSDFGRSSINASAYYSTNGGATYTLLGTEDKVNGGGGAIAFMFSITPATDTANPTTPAAYLGDNAAITDLEFTFDNSQANGAQGLSEIAAFGSVVPEPSGWAMAFAGLGLLGIGQRLRGTSLSKR